MSAVNAVSSSGCLAILRCVDRWPSIFGAPDAGRTVIADRDGEFVIGGKERLIDGAAVMELEPHLARAHIQYLCKFGRARADDGVACARKSYGGASNAWSLPFALNFSVVTIRAENDPTDPVLQLVLSGSY